MKHFYNTIEGWTTFQKLYSEMVQKFPNGSKFVEVGSFKGKSAAYMAVEIVNSNKNIDFYCVDVWEWSVPNTTDINLGVTFLNNMEPVKEYIKPIKDTSVNASLMFEDNSLDFIFIDAGHSYSDVKADIEAWYPKLKPTGVFAGHDYKSYWPGVVRAVNEFVKNTNVVLTCNNNNPSTWVIYDNTRKTLKRV